MPEHDLSLAQQFDRWAQAGRQGEPPDLRDAHLEGADLTGGDLSGCRLEGANLNFATLRGVDLRGAHLSGASLEGAEMQDAKLHDADLPAANLRGAKLSGARFEGANLEACKLTNADLRGVHLGAAQIDADALRGVVLRPVNLRRAELRGVQARQADLDRATLRLADLREADLRSANLAGADLIGANLAGADLRGADLRGAELAWADFRGADLRDVQLDEEALTSALGDHSTLLSAPTRSPESWDSSEQGPEEAPRVALELAPATPVPSLQSLALELAQWGERFTTLAQLTGVEPLIPLTAVGGTPPNRLELDGVAPALVEALAALWCAVLRARHAGDTDPAVAPDATPSPTWPERVRRAPFGTTQADQLLARLLRELSDFRSRGGRLRCTVPTAVLEREPRLRAVLGELQLREGGQARG